LFEGSDSNYILEEDVSAIEDLFLDSEFISIDGAGHWVHAEAPDVFIERTLSFLLR
jgi:pimeloyl-ACP methyl ester carboxylesterase